MLQLFRRLNSRSVSMSTKILVLLMVSVTFGLGAAGWIIYRGLKARTFENASEALLQSANLAAMGLDASGLEGPHKSPAAHRAALARMRAALRRVYTQNRFDHEDRSTRISLVRFMPADRELELELVLSLEGDSAGRRETLPDAIYRVALRQEAAVLPIDSENADWMVAFAPLPKVRGSTVYLLKLERNISPLRRQLMGQIGTIVLGALLGLALSLAGGWFVTRQITQPLRTFVDVMRLMQSTGDYDMRIDLHPEDKDMGVVEKTFQSLVSRMRDSRDREEQSYWSTLQALVTALDVRDNETAGHSMRVTRFSLAIGERLRLRPEVMEQLRQGALLHDIGKIGVPDAVLRKAGKLNAAEWDEMRKHPAIGRTFLEDITFLRPAMAVVYCHHERWDGKGYPQGLSGDAIPLAARIFAVADALDAITSQRYYKAARSFREAQAEIEKSAGSHFDPAVVKAFLTIPEKAILRIRSETSMAGVELERLRKSAA